MLGRRKELILSLLVLDPPAPLQSPLVLESRWHHVPDELPEVRSYELGFDGPDGVYIQAQSNVGVWGDRSGGIRLTDVTDSSLRGDIRAILTQIYPDEKYLPDVELRGTFWAPHTMDLSTD